MRDMFIVFENLKKSHFTILRIFAKKSTLESEPNSIMHTVRNLHYLSKKSTSISRENCRFFWVKNSLKCWGFLKIRVLSKSILMLIFGAKIQLLLIWNDCSSRNVVKWYFSIDFHTLWRWRKHRQILIFNAKVKFQFRFALDLNQRKNTKSISFVKMPDASIVRFIYSLKFSYLNIVFSRGNFPRSNYRYRGEKNTNFGLWNYF